MSGGELRVGYDAPFFWAGSKRRVSDVIWQALGDVDNYVEPFAGSLATLLRRPEDHKRTIETVSDLDGFVANFWRSVKMSPVEVAKWCDYPVSHIDMTVRHQWLVAQRETLMEQLATSPDWHDPKIAGWWCWGLNMWIGSGWCDAKRPHLSNGGVGIHATRPHLSNGGQAPTQAEIIHLWMDGLCARLRRVRIVHGSWERVASPGSIGPGRITGVMLDPPYDPKKLAHSGVLYAEHSSSVSAECRDWAIDAVKSDERMRIVLCGYSDEHVMPDDWRCLSWSSSGMQVSKSGGGSGTTRHKERIWLSPSCLEVDLEGTICRLDTEAPPERHAPSQCEFASW